MTPVEALPMNNIFMYVSYIWHLHIFVHAQHSLFVMFITNCFLYEFPVANESETNNELKVLTLGKPVATKASSRKFEKCAPMRFFLFLFEVYLVCNKDIL